MLRLDDSRVAHAPFSDAQVAALQARQGVGHLHEYTCPDGDALDVTHDGFDCRECGYRQDWAHAADAAR